MILNIGSSKKNWLNLKEREDIDANTFIPEFEEIKEEYNLLRVFIIQIIILN